MGETKTTNRYKNGTKSVTTMQSDRSGRTVVTRKDGSSTTTRHPRPR